MQTLKETRVRTREGCEHHQDTLTTLWQSSPPSVPSLPKMAAGHRLPSAITAGRGGEGRGQGPAPPMGARGGAGPRRGAAPGWRGGAGRAAVGSEAPRREQEPPASTAPAPPTPHGTARNAPGPAAQEFEDPRDADDAVYELDGKELCSERVTIEHARARSRGGRGRGRYSDRFSSRRPRSDRSRSAPPVRTENRLIVENLSSRVSWQPICVVGLMTRSACGLS
uniref:Serine and arginine rich splicing factor 5 n=1 Tax=Anas platyrhynchos TaxID=8839 RepID=A0A8B9R379_ANAPL